MERRRHSRLRKLKEPTNTYSESKRLFLVGPKRKYAEPTDGESVTLLYVLRETLGAPIWMLNSFLTNRESKDALLQPKIQFRKYPDKDAFNIDLNVFASLALGFPVGYLHKPIPLSLAKRIIDDIDMHLAAKLIENKYKIVRHIRTLLDKLEKGGS